MNHYCTLFNINYLSRGLALYESLLATGADFHLSIIAFDDKTFTMLEALDLARVTVVALERFETSALLEVKPSRTMGEYCWTSTPASIQHVLSELKVPSCTYLDADLYFFNDPTPLINEMGQASILLTQHHYTPMYNSEEASGKYCVQFMCFKNTQEGLAALNWWSEKCLEWCYARVEPNRFGDQKYLDDWTTRFKGVHVLEHLGGGVAPWNVQQYQLKSENNQLIGYFEGKPFDVVFYHFHELRFLSGGRVDFGGYQLSKDVLEFIYKPYVQHLIKIEKEMESRFGPIEIHGVTPFNGSWLKTLKRKIKGCDNLFNIKGDVWLSS